VDPQVQPFVQMLDQLHQDLYAVVEPLTDREINWAHPHLSNTIGILLRHIAGSERSWIVQTVGGRPVRRNRDAEFVRETLSKAALVDDLRRAHQEARQVIEGLTAADLTRAVAVTFRGTPQTFTAAWALMNSLQHTGYHLGQIQLFKKMAASAAAAHAQPPR